MAGLNYLLKEYKTACGNTVNVGDVVMDRYGCSFFVVKGIELCNKSQDPSVHNSRVVLIHYCDKDRDEKQRWCPRTESLKNYHLVKNGVLILKPE
jgi:hypothetical protein